MLPGLCSAKPMPRKDHRKIYEDIRASKPEITWMSSYIFPQDLTLKKGGIRGLIPSFVNNHEH